MVSFPTSAICKTGATENQTVLFLHGFLGCKEDWGNVIARLDEKLSAISIDLPGHGANLPDDDNSYNMNDCAKSIISLLDEHDLSGVHLVGYSMGGRLALYMTVRYPEQFSRIVLESASPGLRTELERMERIKHDKEVINRLQNQPLEEFLNNWYEQPLFSDLPETIMSRRMSNSTSGLSMSLIGMGTGAQPSLWESLFEISNPLLLIAGAADEKFSKIGKQMADLCPAASLSIIEDSKHLVHVEQETEYMKTLNSFLCHD